VVWAILLIGMACAPVAPLGPVTVTLTVDGETQVLTTEAKTVRDLLIEAGVALDEDDRVTPPENTFLAPGTTIRVVRVEVQTETEQRTIPYEREIVRDVTVPTGETRLLRAGVNGIEEITYAVRLEDGVQVERRVVRREMVQQIVNEVVLIGAREEVTAVPISGTIAYLSNQNAWMMRGTTGNRRRLTSTGDLDGRVFDLSSDGAWLLFTRASAETDTLNTLWMVDTLTADADPVRLDAENVLWAGWAPDSQRMAYSTGSVRQEAPGWEAANDLYTARPRSSDGQLLGRRQVLAPSAGGAYGWWGTRFAWIPGERQDMMAYARADQVGLVRLSDGQMTPLIQFPSYRTRAAWAWTPAVAWSPDGSFILTLVHGAPPSGELPEDSPVFDLYALGFAEMDNGVITPTVTAELASEVGMWAPISFSPDGQRILFGRARVPYSSNTSDYDLYVMDRDGSDRRPFFVTAPHEPGLKYQDVIWDPGGGQIAIILHGDLYLLTTEGQLRRITEDGTATMVRWAGGGAEE
jgi:hypothetical protein